MEQTKLRATPAARKLADRLGVNLFNVSGTGYKGRIHKDDIANFNYEKKVHISPLARSIAQIHNIELKDIQGSGHHGKIMKADVVALIDNFEKTSSIIHTTEFIETTTSQTEPQKKSTTTATISISNSSEKTDRLAMSMMRKVIAKRMTESYTTAPVFAQNWEVDMANLLDLRKKIIDDIKEKTGKKLTVTDLISLAVIRALMHHKYINASLSDDGNEIIFHNYVNLGMAVGLEEGLMVPVVANADQMTLSQLVVALKDVTERTVNKKITPDEQKGSTFTISNLGMYGVTNFTSIINQPNSAILSVASTIQKPVVVDAQVVIKPIMTLTLTSDHRVIDGVAAAKFMQELKNNLENPLSLLI